MKGWFSVDKQKFNVSKIFLNIDFGMCKMASKGDNYFRRKSRDPMHLISFKSHENLT